VGRKRQSEKEERQMAKHDGCLEVVGRDCGLEVLGTEY
jgi:hypothetical protein